MERGGELLDSILDAPYGGKVLFYLFLADPRGVDEGDEKAGVLDVVEEDDGVKSKKGDLLLECENGGGGINNLKEPVDVVLNDKLVHRRLEIGMVSVEFGRGTVGTQGGVLF